MGQYYNVVTEDKDGVMIAYDRSVDGEYTMAKLMEHSWWYNPFVSTIVKRLYKNPMRVAWVGDYSDDVKDAWRIDEIFKAAWGGGAMGIKGDEMRLDGKYLVNHSDKTYLDCSAYRNRSEDMEDPNWIIHPLPLLTSVGNGFGGGDYRGTDMDMVGSWYMSEISVEDVPPDGYTAIEVTFTEK